MSWSVLFLILIIKQSQLSPSSFSRQNTLSRVTQEGGLQPLGLSSCAQVPVQTGLCQ